MIGNVSHASAEMNNTNQFLAQCPISAHCLYSTLKIWHCENMIATVFHNCRSFREKVVTIILFTFFIGIDAPKVTNETLITIKISYAFV